MTREFLPATGAWIADDLEMLFPEGALVRTDAHTGQRIATGPDAYGLVRSLHLDVPLCNCCDAPLDAGVCYACELVFTDVAPVTRVGKRWRTAA